MTDKFLMSRPARDMFCMSKPVTGSENPESVNQFRSIDISNQMFPLKKSILI